MKTLVIISLAALLFSACNKGDMVAPSSSLPAHFNPYFQIVNKNTGKDLFTSSDTYDEGAIKVYLLEISVNGEVKRDPLWHEQPPDTIWHEQRGDSTILMLSQMLAYRESSYTYLLELTPTDYDTVSIYYEAEQGYDERFKTSFATPKKARVSYNGALIKEHDFTNDTTLYEKVDRGQFVHVFYKDVGD